MMNEIKLKCVRVDFAARGVSMYRSMLVQMFSGVYILVQMFSGVSICLHRCFVVCLHACTDFCGVSLCLCRCLVVCIRSLVVCLYACADVCHGLGKMQYRPCVARLLS